ncbi:hypothetical protein Syun_001620 [Stephania yunnanensis]|uniref:Secreted protein n=1 Tax=Stephania yunnanensis TaxID=152371 RepID=A0AAP0Q6M4_9MAGN
MMMGKLLRLLLVVVVVGRCCCCRWLLLTMAATVEMGVGGIRLSKEGEDQWVICPLKSALGLGQTQPQ